MEFRELFKNGKLLIFRTILTYVSMLGLGACVTLLGTAVLDLEILIQGELVKYAIPARQIGYFAGAVSGAIMERFWDQQISIIIADAIGALALAATPFCRGLPSILTCILMSGICMGLIDTCTNVYIVLLWRRRCANFMQILHLCYGAGSLMIPLIVNPFLLPLIRDEGTSSLVTNLTATTTEIPPSLTSPLVPEPGNGTKKYSPDEVLIKYPFWIVAVYFTLAALGFLYTTILSRRSKSYEEVVGETAVTTSEPEKEGSELKEESAESDGDSNKRAIQITAIAFFLIICNVAGAIDNAIGSLGPVYGVQSDLNMTKQDASSSVSLFWLLFAFTRIPYMFLSALIGDVKMLNITNTIFVSSVLILLPHATYSRTAYLVGLTVLGIGESALYPAGVGYIQRYIRVTGPIASGFMISVCIGKFIYPSIISENIETTPNVFIYVLCCLITIWAGLLWVLEFICVRHLPVLSTKPAIKK